LATHLAELGVGKGDVVCLALPTSIDYAVAYQAALRLGAITSGINSRLGAAEKAIITARLEPAVTIFDPAQRPPGPTGHALHRSELRGAFAREPHYRRPRLDPSDPVTVVWTSGTTDQPKGAVYDHRRLEAMAAAAPPMSQPGDRRLFPLPFAHSGYMTRLWDELSNGITSVLTSHDWTAGEALALIHREKVTVGQGVPTQWNLMLRHADFESTDFSAMLLHSGVFGP
jgi:acyl-CoA synthetase (AMP-forming)/AMP-acid ligase II